jgi:hypothetical protein
MFKSIRIAALAAVSLAAVGLSPAAHAQGISIGPGGVGIDTGVRVDEGYRVRREYRHGGEYRRYGDYRRGHDYGHHYGYNRRRFHGDEQGNFHRDHRFEEGNNQDGDQ